MGSILASLTAGFGETRAWGEGRAGPGSESQLSALSKKQKWRVMRGVRCLSFEISNRQLSSLSPGVRMGATETRHLWKLLDPDLLIRIRLRRKAWKYKINAVSVIMISSRVQFEGVEEKGWQGGWRSCMTTGAHPTRHSPVCSSCISFSKEADY